MFFSYSSPLSPPSPFSPPSLLSLLSLLPLSLSQKQALHSPTHTAFDEASDSVIEFVGFPLEFRKGTNCLTNCSAALLFFGDCHEHAIEVFFLFFYFFLLFIIYYLFIYLMILFFIFYLFILFYFLIFLFFECKEWRNSSFYCCSRRI